MPISYMLISSSCLGSYFFMIPILFLLNYQWRNGQFLQVTKKVEKAIAHVFNNVSLNWSITKEDLRGFFELILVFQLGWFLAYGVLDIPYYESPLWLMISMSEISAEIYKSNCYWYFSIKAMISYNWTDYWYIINILSIIHIIMIMKDV